MIVPLSFQYSNNTFDFYGFMHRTFLQVSPGGSVTTTLVGSGNLSNASVNLSGTLIPVGSL